MYNSSLGIAMKRYKQQYETI